MASDPLLSVEDGFRNDTDEDKVHKEYAASLEIKLARLCQGVSATEQNLRRISFLEAQIKTYSQRVNLEDVVVRAVDSFEGPLEDEKIYSLSMAPDRFAASDKCGQLDVQCPDGNLASQFISAWDQKGREFEKEFRKERFNNRELVRRGCDEKEAKRIISGDVGQGHRIVFDTDGHYRRLYDVCMSVKKEIVEVSFTVNFMVELLSDPKYADVSGDFVYSNPKFWYCVFALLGILYWLARSLDMSRSVIRNDKEYHRNFYSDPSRWGIFCGYSSVSTGILWIWVTKELPAMFCISCEKSAAQEKEWRAFTLWRSIFLMCLFGIPRDVMDIITILHPEKVLARAWPCHSEVKPENNDGQSDVRTMHRIWQYWFPGELWEYNFENLAVRRNLRFLIFTKFAKIGISLFLFTLVRPGVRAMATFAFSCWSLIPKLQSMLSINAKASQFKKQQYEDLKDPEKKGKAKRNLRLFWP